MAAEVCGETYLKNDKEKELEKTATDVTSQPHKLKGNAERENRAKVLVVDRVFKSQEPFSY